TSREAASSQNKQTCMGTIRLKTGKRTTSASNTSAQPRHKQKKVRRKRYYSRLRYVSRKCSRHGQQRRCSSRMKHLAHPRPFLLWLGVEEYLLIFACSLDLHPCQNPGD